MAYDKPVTIQQIDEDTEQWSDLWNLHARINNRSKGSEVVQGGAVQSQSMRYFEFRYFDGIEVLDRNRGLYRLVYRGRVFNIIDYDDYMESHKTVRIKAESYGD